MKPPLLQLLCQWVKQDFTNSDLCQANLKKVKNICAKHGKVNTHLKFLKPFRRTKRIFIRCIIDIKLVFHNQKSGHFWNMPDGSLTFQQTSEYTWCHTKITLSSGYWFEPPSDIPVKKITFNNLKTK